MMRILIATLVLASTLSLAVPLAAAPPEMCKDWPSQQGWELGQIDIAYVEPKDDAFSAIYDSLKDRQVLEELQEFLSPVRLPRKVLVKFDQCDQSYRPYQPGGPVTLCYEYISRLAALATKIPAGGTTARGVSRDDAMVGAVVQALLHEMSLVLMDQQELPVWGREQDAADQLTAFLMMQFDKKTARKLVNGAAFFFEASERTWTGSDFSDVKSPEPQRFYNFLCLAYGSDPRAFADFVADRDPPPPYLLPPRRADNCTGEYWKFKWAFDVLIKPCLDQELLEKVQSRVDWLRPPGGE
jgi:hypothetical protein